MLRTYAAFILAAGLALSFTACDKKEEAKTHLPPGHPGMGTGAPGGAPGMEGGPKVERTIVVPKDVKKKWKSVKIIVEDKGSKRSKEYTVAIGSTFTVPKTKITVKVLAFLPHFMMGNNEITSASNMPKMPAARVLVQEPGMADWTGWLFSKQPDMHPFPHEKIGIKLAAIS